MFLDTLMSDSPPQCLIWLPLLHRLANVENGNTLNNIRLIIHITHTYLCFRDTARIFTSLQYHEH